MFLNDKKAAYFFPVASAHFRSVPSAHVRSKPQRKCIETTQKSGKKTSFVAIISLHPLKKQAIMSLLPKFISTPYKRFAHPTIFTSSFSLPSLFTGYLISFQSCVIV